MSVLVRFTINEQFGGPSFNEIATALALQGRGNGTEHPEFVVWGTGSYPNSTVVEYYRSENLVSALQGVNRAIDAASLRGFCTGGDLHLPESPF